jgi:hypothetical protein
MSEVRVTDPKTGGQKGSKPERFDLIPWDAMEEVSRVYAFGAQKYDDHNWLKGYKWSLSFAALFRHVAKAMLGEDRDPESGLLHLAHAAFHCLALITFVIRELGTDDRFKSSYADSEDEPIGLVPVEPAPMEVAPRFSQVMVERDGELAAMILKTIGDDSQDGIPDEVA